MVHPRAFLVAVALTCVTASAADPGAVRTLPEMTLPLARGGTARVVEPADALTALVFFRTGHDRSTETLRMLVGCRPRLVKEPVRVVGVVPADSAEAAPGLVDAAGVDLPLLVDAEDRLYAAAGVRTHPAIVLVDRARRVVAFEPYHQVDYCDVVVARVQRALGKIGDAEVAQVLTPAATRLPGDSPAAVAHRHVGLARRLLAARAFAPAHENARKAIALAPSADAWRVEGEVFAAEGRCPDAVRAFDAALSLAPADAAALAARKACGR
jgi:tetratricopeptide (TPR) repeat protein